MKIQNSSIIMASSHHETSFSYKESMTMEAAKSKDVVGAILTLSQEVIKMVANGSLSAGHARALISLPETDQVKIAAEAVKKGASVRDVEQMVKDHFTPPEEKERKKQKTELSAELKELIVNMQRVLGTKVNAIGNDRKGRIYIDYYTRDDLDRLSEIIEAASKPKKI